MTRLHPRFKALLVLAGLALTSACVSPLDTLGNESIVTESEHLSKDPQAEDDRIEDKHPVFDDARITEEVFGTCTVKLNKSATVTKLDVLPFSKGERALQEALFANRLMASREIDAIPDADLIPSMEVVNGFLKPFNDGLYAAIEVGVQEGIQGEVASKRQFLTDLLDAVLAALALAGSSEQQAQLQSAAVFVGAALLAGGNEASLDAGLLAQAEAEAAHFLSDGLFARPVGFYTWNDTLAEVFRQDRFLQNLGTDNRPSQFGRFAALAIVLAGDADLLARYQTLLALYGGLTNPAAAYTPVDLMPLVDELADLDKLEQLRDTFLADHPEPFVCTQAWFALLPASRSRDTAFYNENWCLTGLPTGVSFIDAFIAAIRDGGVDLAPDEDSGWYDYQLWALETLLLPERGPESDHLLLTAAYKKKLIDTFKSIITQNRETHVKELQSAGSTGADEQIIHIYPKFALEPFPSFYLRSARAYRFLGPYLEAVLGAAALEQLHRLDEDDGLSEASLAAELEITTQRLYGLYVLSARSVGLDPKAHLLDGELSDQDLLDCAGVARTWLDGWRTDPDVIRDPRVIVPVAHDPAGLTVYWAVLGVKPLKVFTEFVAGHEPEVIFGDTCRVDGVDPHTYYLLVEHMEEVRIRSDAAPPTREEFRALCDEHDSAAAIVDALEAL